MPNIKISQAERKEFSKLRHALIERGRRLEAAGIGSRMELPKLRDIKNRTDYTKALRQLKKYSAAGTGTVTSTRQKLAKKSGKKTAKSQPKKPTNKPIEKAKRRKIAITDLPIDQRGPELKKRRERRIKYDMAKYGMSRKQAEVYENVKKLEIKLPPSKIREFCDYLAYRDAANTDKQRYVILDAAEDFMDLPEHVQNDIGQLTADFQAWQVDMAEKGRQLAGASEDLWSEYLKQADW